ncbi:MAG: hypothetical protein IIV13_00805 [Bacteroidaceae bacterium]|nr:hypothetical protein [Bacteroidaceae bacterium]MBQ5655889.1 hypothetical protein [Bacteroidaceae bacterium]
MTRFTAQLNDMSYINIKADTMEVIDNMLHVRDGNNLVAVIDLSAVVAAHISERTGRE